MRRAPLSLGCALALTLACGAASAMPTAKLVYVRAPGAEGCPDEDALRAEVEARLGYKPFRVVADNTLYAEVRRGAPGFVADMKLIGDKGVTRGVRRLESASNDCSDIARALALSMSIALDPLSLTRPPGTPPPEEPPEAPPVVALEPEAPPPPPPPPPRPPEPRAPPSDARVEPSVGLAGGVSFGASPAVAPALALFGALRYRFASVEAGFLAQVPSPSHTSQGGTAATRLLVAPLGLCGHASWVSLCAMGLLGQAEGEASGITSPRSEALFFAALGPRVGLTVPLPAGLFARATADALFPLTPFSLGINGQTVWSSSAVMGLLQGGVGWRFP